MAGMTDVVAKYLENHSSGGYSKEQIMNAMDALRNSIDDFSSNNSLFEVKDMNEEAFMSLMRDITNSSDGSLDDSISILYDVLNTDGESGISSDEFTAAFDNLSYKTAGDGSVSNYELWVNLCNTKDYVSRLPASDKVTTDADEPLDGDSVELSEDVPVAEEDTTPVQTRKVNVDECVEQLHNAMEGRVGTDEDLLKDILFDESISDEDFAQIVAAYEAKYGLDGETGRGLVTRIEKETSGNLQKELTAQLGKRLVAAAEKGDQTAIDMLCKEIYSGTAGQNCTANDFLTAVFNDETDPALIAKINAKYSEVNNGRDLRDDIKKDYDGLFGIGGWFNDYGPEGNAILRIIDKSARYTYDE